MDSSHIDNPESEINIKERYMECPIHKKNIVALSVNANQKHILKCIYCLSENQQQCFIPLEQLIESDDSTIFQNSPLQLDRDLFDKLVNLSQGGDFIETLQKKIDNYFQSLKKDINEKIDSKKQEMLDQAISMRNFQSEIIKKYNDFIAKQELKRIITEERNDIEKQNDQLKQIIQNIQSNQSDYQTSLQNLILNLENQKNMIDFTIPDKISLGLLAQIDQIDIFKLNDPEDLFIENYEVQRDSILNNLDNLKPSEMKPSQLILKLLTSRFNNCSQELEEKLIELIVSLSTYIDKQDIQTYVKEDTLSVDFHKLNQQQFHLISRLADSFIKDNNGENISVINDNINQKILLQLINNKFNNCPQSFLQKLSKDFDRISPYIESLDLSDQFDPNQISNLGQNLTQEHLNEVIEIIKDLEMKNNSMEIHQNESLINQKIENFNAIFENKTNYCSQEFILDVQRASQRYKQLISHLFLKNNVFVDEDKQPMKFNNLNDNQLTNIEILSKKIADLSTQYGDDYIGRKSPSRFSQLQSNAFYQKISDLLDYSNSKIVQQLLADYPIFDLRDNLFIKKIQFNFDQGKTHSSKEIKIIESNQGNPIICQEKSLIGQVITKESLNINENYIIRCKVNKNLDCESIIFGIIKSGVAYTEQIQKEKCCFKSKEILIESNKIIKGEYLSNISKTLNHIEIRISIKNKLVQFADYPNYNNINQVDPANINENFLYRFGIQFYGPGDDYSIEITEVLLVDEKYIKF